MVAYSGTSDEDSWPARRRVHDQLIYVDSMQGVVDVRNATGVPFWGGSGTFAHGRFAQAPGDGLVANGGEVFSCVSDDGDVVEGSVSWTADSGAVALTVHVAVRGDRSVRLAADFTGNAAGGFAARGDGWTIELTRSG